MVEDAIEYSVGDGAVNIFGVRIPAAVYVSFVFDVVREECREDFLVNKGCVAASVCADIENNRIGIRLLNCFFSCRIRVSEPHRRSIPMN